MAVSWRAAALFFSALLAVACGDFGSSMPGAPVKADMNDPGLKSALQLAVAEHNKRSGGEFYSKVSRVIQAQKQIVAGIKYIFSVKMAYTVCRKTAVKKRCAINRNKKLAKPFICDFEVWSQPWLNKSSVVKSSCKN
ncbi:cystatin-like [Arapaima gigas]